MRFLADNRSELIVSIGEDGLTALYYHTGVFTKRLFCKAAQPEFTKELEDLMAKDPTMRLTVYLDHQFQNYTQQTIPGVNIISAEVIAKRKARTTSSGERGQSTQMIYRLGSGRKDWVYLFLDVDFQGKVSMWLDYLTSKLDNIMGIYALPTEAFALIERLRENEKVVSAKSFFKFLSPENRLRWDVLVSAHKSGGLRITAFFNQHPVFSRLVAEFASAQDLEVAANILTQEINNSLEYLRRLNYSVHSIAEARVYVVAAAELKNILKTEGLETQNITIFSPKEVSNKLRLPERLTTPKDRYADPVMLHLAHKRRFKKISFTPKTFKQNLEINRFISYLLYLVKLSIPGVVLMIAYLFLTAAYLEFTTQELNTELKSLSTTLINEIAYKKEQEQKLSGGLTVAHINEIVNSYKYLAAHNVDILGLLSQFGQVDGDYIRVRKVRWQMDSSRLKDKVLNPTTGRARDQKITDSLRYFLELNSVFYAPKLKYEELTKFYKQYTDDVSRFFDCCTVRVELAEEEFKFEDIGKPTEIRVLVEYKS